ncbi:Integrator complex subunit 3 [Thoreauomyces humboldtii]|nr:Integrator complex subunit 3 [Thoreauomyces humboldtii]
MARHIIFDLDDLIDKEDPREKVSELCAAYAFIQNLRAGKDEGQFVRLLNEQVDSAATHVYGGLLYATLTLPHQSSTHAKLLELVVNDNFHLVSDKLYQLIADLDLMSCAPFRKMRSFSKGKILDLVDRLVDINIIPAQRLLVVLTRQIRGGDVSSENLALAKSLISMLKKHTMKFTPGADLVPATVYSFLRLIADHAKEASLRQSEVEYVCHMLRTRFHECMRIGRDFFRVLTAVKNIPEIHAIVADLKIPGKLHPSFRATPSDPWIIAQRITQEMDTKIRFILDKVQNYRSQHLNHDGNEAAYPDVVRFICTIKSPEARQDAKLALFFDWLFWNPGRDNIMYIEPAMLLMEKTSLSSIPARFPGEAIEYLHIAVTAFMPSLTPELRRNVNFAMHSLVTMKVTTTTGLRKMYAAPSVSETTRQHLSRLWAMFLKEGQAVPSLNDLATGVAALHGVAGDKENGKPNAASPSTRRFTATPIPMEVEEEYPNPMDIELPTDEQVLRHEPVAPALAFTATDEQMEVLVTGWRTTGQRDSVLAALRNTVKPCRARVARFVLLNVERSELTEMYEALATPLGLHLGDMLVDDLEMLQDTPDDEFAKVLVPAACRTFPVQLAAKVERFIECVIGGIGTGTLDHICTALGRDEYELFGNSNKAVLISASIVKWDEVTVMFLWDLLTAELSRVEGSEKVEQGGGYFDRVDDRIGELCRDLRPIDISPSPATVRGLTNLLCHTTSPDPYLLVAAMRARFPVVFRHWMRVVHHNENSKELVRAVLNLLTEIIDNGNKDLGTVDQVREALKSVGQEEWMDLKRD